MSTEPEPAEATPEGGSDGDPQGPTFADLGLHPTLVEAVAALGYDEPTPIQAQAIPILVDGRDLLGLAATGTGKTAAFALPLLHALQTGSRDGRPRALVLVPTRELARQVARALKGYAREQDVQVLEVYGGASMRHQLRMLDKGVDVVVATPGRALDHLQRGSLDLSALTQVVLDEADEMLDMGFQEDLEAILGATPDGRQTALFSATFPDRLRGLAKRHQTGPARVEIPRTQEAERPRITERVHVVRRAHKAAALARVLAVEAPTAALIFCRTRVDVDRLAEELDEAGTRVEALHGGLSQGERDRVMKRLREGIADLVVATDVAARGLDVDHLSHVINYDVPDSPEPYVHRIGRTGRAGRQGVAIMLAEPRDRNKVRNIERTIKRRIPVADLPGVDDLQAARLGRLADRIAEGVGRMVDEEDDAADAAMAPYRSLAEDLLDEGEAVDLLAAALHALAEATGEAVGNEQEIPDGRRPPPWHKEHDGGRNQGGGRPGDTRGGDARGGGKPGDSRGGGPGWTRLFVSIGRNAGLRPGDLVGAIAGETHLPGKAIGYIDIKSSFSLVDVPTNAAQAVIAALQNTTIRGRRPTVKVDRYSH
ncbi:MAG: DEAD/DEAH box helicase [Alphaproteobacteria bacterium]|nr:DEAD/DEAH box helicase [Alphaproteobacteria bacterium]